MKIRVLQPAATGAFRPASTAQPTPASRGTQDQAEVSDGKASQAARKMGWSLGGAALGGVAGYIGMHFVTPLLVPLIGLGVGAVIAAGPMKVGGKKLSEWLSPFKAREGASEAEQAAAKRKNWYVRIGAGVVGGLMAAHFAAPALMLGTLGAGMVAGWKIGSRQAE